VRRAGYGAMHSPVTESSGPPRDRDEALRVLRTAVDSGVNHLDTAQYYGPGVAQLAALITARNEGLIDGIGLRHLPAAPAESRPPD